MNAHLYGTPDELRKLEAHLLNSLDPEIAQFGVQLDRQIEDHAARTDWSRPWGRGRRFD